MRVSVKFTNVRAEVDISGTVAYLSIMDDDDLGSSTSIITIRSDRRGFTTIRDAIDDYLRKSDEAEYLARIQAMVEAAS